MDLNTELDAETLELLESLPQAENDEVDIDEILEEYSGNTSVEGMEVDDEFINKLSEDITKILKERLSSAQRDLQVLEEKAVSKKSEISNG